VYALPEMDAAGASPAFLPVPSVGPEQKLLKQLSAGKWLGRCPSFLTGGPKVRVSQVVAKSGVLTEAGSDEESRVPGTDAAGWLPKFLGLSSCSYSTGCPP
jgi:hypothetical protein